MTDLLPCPFCGRSGPTIVGYWPDMSGLNMRVRCTCGVAVGGGIDEDADRERWNTRALTRQAQVSDEAASAVAWLRETANKRPSEGLIERQGVTEDAIKYGRALLLAAADQIEQDFKAEPPAGRCAHFDSCPDFEDAGDTPASQVSDDAVVERVAEACAAHVVEWFNGPPKDGDDLDLTDTVRAALASATNSEAVSELEAAKAALDACPELNMSNYDHDDVVALNDAAIETWKILDAAIAKLGSRAP